MSEDKFLLQRNPLYSQNAIGAMCHPDAPSGGGGFGRFMQAGSLGTEAYLSKLYLHPLAPSSRQMVAPPATVPVAGAAIDITALPRIMDANKWPTGAALMRGWFARGEHTAPDYDTPDTGTITMDWVLGFKRAQAVFDDLVKDKIWQNAAAKNQVALMLKAKGLLKKHVSYEASFGDFTLPVPDLHAEHVNFRTVGMSSFSLDDLDAALGRFAFHVLVRGTVSGDLKGVEVKVDAVAVYVKDSYDFVGDQSLGYWDPEDNSASAINRFSGTEVTNLDFRNWRALNRMGGDYLVFSDLKVLTLAQPSVFKLTP